MRVAARHEELWVVSVRCGLCRRQQVFWVALADLHDGASLPCDPSPEEQEEFDKLPPVASDDVLDMYEFLEGFNGDFQRLFSERSPKR